MRAVYAASATDALPAAVGSMRSPGIFVGLPSVGLSISGEQGGGSPMSVNLAEGIALSHKLMRFTGSARLH